MLHLPYPPPYNDQTMGDMYSWVTKYNGQASLANRWARRGRLGDAEYIKAMWQEKRIREPLFGRICRSFDGNFYELWRILWENDEIMHMNPDSDDDDDSAQQINAKKRRFEEAFGPSRPAGWGEGRCLWLVSSGTPFHFHFLSFPSLSFLISSSFPCCWCCPMLVLQKKNGGNLSKD